MTVYLESGDIKFYYSTPEQGDVGPAVIRITDTDLHRDPGLETAILISLFTEARAREQDELPLGTTFRSGYWGSMLERREIGSRLWLLRRSTISETMLRHVEQYCKDALQWMIDDGLASSVVAVASKAGGGRVNFMVTINRPESDVNFRFFINWELQIYGGIE